jgi:hypothetical protein
MTERRRQVVVPYAGPDVEPTRQSVAAELHAHGYRMVARASLDELQRCPLAVFLLGRTHVRELEESLHQWVTLSKHVIVWIDPTGDMEDKQVAFADRLFQKLPGDHIRDSSVSDLRQAIRERLHNGFPATITSRVEAAAQSGLTSKQVLLIARAEDRACAQNLKGYIEQAGFAVLELSLGTSFSDHRTQNIAHLRAAAGVLLFAQTEGLQWMRNQLHKLRQYPAPARIAEAVMLVDPPEKPRMIESAQERGFAFGVPLRLLVCAKDQVTPEQLQPFLHTLASSFA